MSGDKDESSLLETFIPKPNGPNGPKDIRKRYREGGRLLMNTMKKLSKHYSSHQSVEQICNDRMTKYYFDNNSTTYVPNEIRDAYMKYLNCGNPSNINHALGRASAKVINVSRRMIADDFQCSEDEVVFTSCATESNNAIIQGLVHRFVSKENPIHILVSAIEHKCVLETVTTLSEKHPNLVTYEEIPVSVSGVISVSDVKRMVEKNKNTRLICVMYANNELGTYQPVKEIGTMLRKLHCKTGHKIHFHVDAVAAIGKQVIHPSTFCDSMSVSGHKIHCVKGVGCLYVTNTMVPFIQPITFGGKQETIRSGTSNTAAIYALAKALEMVHTDREVKNMKMQKLKITLLDRLRKKEIPFEVLGGEDYDKVLPNTILFSFSEPKEWNNTDKFVCNKKLIKHLDDNGISCSIGSSCNTKSEKASHVLAAIKATQDQKRGTIRITMSDFTTPEDINHLISSIHSYFLQ